MLEIRAPAEVLSWSPVSARLLPVSFFQGLAAAVGSPDSSEFDHDRMMTVIRVAICWRRAAGPMGCLAPARLLARRIDPILVATGPVLVRISWRASFGRGKGSSGLDEGRNSGDHGAQL